MWIRLLAIHLWGKKNIPCMGNQPLQRCWEDLHSRYLPTPFSRLIQNRFVNALLGSKYWHIYVMWLTFQFMYQLFPRYAKILVSSAWAFPTVFPAWLHVLQADVLYKLIGESAGLKGDGSEIILDLFCGTGTIGLTLARR